MNQWVDLPALRAGVAGGGWRHSRRRIALSLWLLLAMLPGVQADDDLALAIDAAVEAHMPAAIADVQEWIRYRSVTDATDSYRDQKTALLRQIVRRAQELGLAARLVADGRAAIVDLGDLSDLDRAIGVLVHADVVPANDGAGWDAPPFAGERVGNLIYGRGAADDKGPIAATLHAMAIIQELGLPLGRGVRMIIGTSEENLRWDDMAAVAAEGLVPVEGWTADAAFPVINAEKSFINARVSFLSHADDAGIVALSGGLAPNSVPDTAAVRIRATADLVAMLRRFQPEFNARPAVADITLAETAEVVEVVATGKAAHGSRPDSGVNAITHLAVYLHDSGVLGAVSDSAAARALRFIATAIGLGTDGASLGIARKHDVMGSTTVNLGLVETDQDRVALHFNIRGPEGLPVADVTSALADAAGPFSGQVTLEVAKEPLYVDPAMELVRLLQQSYAAMTGKEPSLLAIGGTTYAKAYPGYVAFGMGFIGESGPVHAPNERLRIDHLQRGMRIYVDAMLRSAAPQRGQGASGNIRPLGG